MITTATAAYIALFIAVGFAFLFAALLLGRFLRADHPTRQKMETYECGEPAIGPSWVRFDLRFYVVALVFLIFDVEVAFFFPWATVFGTTTQLMQPEVQTVVAEVATETVLADTKAEPVLTEREKELALLGVPTSAISAPEDDQAAGEAAAMRKLALVAMADIGLFFAILMVGFAYVWYRGDLDWVRARPPATRAPATRAPASQT